MTAELWARRAEAAGDDRPAHVHEMPWPVADTSLLVHETETLVVQVNGKVRDRIEVPADADEADVRGGGARLRARPGAAR